MITSGISFSLLYYNRGKKKVNKVKTIAEKRKNPAFTARLWRRHPDLNRGVADLQSAALPLGYGAIKYAAFGAA